MALVMLATSVGITTKVHFCSMKKKSETKTASCCKQKAEEEVGCCKPKAETNTKQNSCCNDVVKSVALTAEYTCKFETEKHFSFTPLFIKTFHENLKSFSVKTDVLVSEIKQPPKLFDTNFIYFLQVIKV
jgi:hypothetical protein